MTDSQKAALLAGAEQRLQDHLSEDTADRVALVAAAFEATRGYDRIASKTVNLIIDAIEPLVATRVRAQYEDRMKILAEYENAITWNTTCLGCAGKLDNLIAERAAGYAEGERDAAQLADEVRRCTACASCEAHLAAFERMARPAAGTDQPQDRAEEKL